MFPWKGGGGDTNLSSCNYESKKMANRRISREALIRKQSSSDIAEERGECSERVGGICAVRMRDTSRV